MLKVLDMKNKTVKIIRDNPRVIFAETEISGSVKMEEAVEYIEKNYPKMALEFKNICKEQYELFCTKQFNYGPSNIAVGTDLKKDEDVELSLTGLWFRMNDKIQRLKNLLIFRKADAVDEPVEDSFQDVSNYGIIAQLVSRRKWGK
jgi:hypothetical protein